MSTRIDVLTGDNALIGGFIINGGTTPKKVLLRGIGPSLATGSAPLTGVLADPTLELHKPDGTIISNNDWRSTQEAEIIATGAAPKSDLESAIIATLPPINPSVPGSGVYTAILSGHNGGTGIALVEIYDLDNAAAAPSYLANLSSRGFVQPVDGVMIGGFIVGASTEATQIFIRALGPSLADEQVANPLQNPVLELHNGNGALIVSNDNWADTDKDAIIATGLAPKNAAESAMIASLPAGNYTAVLSGAGNTSGVALIEVYSLH
ncbi:MAG: hypothetical protein H0X40_13770 [Chthoniobacterales bacterium]|nr:hypothetical protein [Chthoniobacterales bacterium]